MAVVFISPKQKQKMFFTGITVMFVLFLAFIFFVAFISSPKEVGRETVFKKAAIDIDMKLFDSEQFKELRPLPEMGKQFSYVATTKDKQQKTGLISATSKDRATTALTDMGLTVTELVEITSGRDNPFLPYYQAVVAPTATATKK